MVAGGSLAVVEDAEVTTISGYALVVATPEGDEAGLPAVLVSPMVGVEIDVDSFPALLQAAADSEN